MTILKSLLALISLILIMNLMTGYLVYRQFSSVEQSLYRDKLLGELLQNESRMQMLVSNYINTNSQQHYSQYQDVLKMMHIQVKNAEHYFRHSPSIQKVMLIKNKIQQAQRVLQKYQKNKNKSWLFKRTKQSDKLSMAVELEAQLRSQLLIIYQEIIVQTLKLRTVEEHENYASAELNIIKLYTLLILSFLIVSYISYLVYKRVATRIAYISAAAQKLGEGNLKVRINSDKNDDMLYLINTFNYMASKLEEAEHKNLQMLTAAEQQAYHDVLTGLPNRRFMSEKMANEISRAIRHDLKGALLFIDLDNFKGLNDSRGHSVGDMLLIEVSKRMSYQIRSEDTLARMGGDEFVLLLPDLGFSADDVAIKAENIAEKIKQALLKPYDLSGNDFSVTASLGVGIFPDDGQDSEELLRHSDIAMYQSKKRGRNCITFYSESMQQTINNREMMKSLLSKAIQTEQLETWFQVKVDQQGKIVGAEVLARWHDLQQGWISPDSFIPLAEQNGLIISLGQWLIRHITQTIARWDQHNLFQQLKHLSINVSPEQFYEPELIDSLIIMGNLFKQYSLQLIIEITEGVLLHNTEDVIQSMALLKANDIMVSIDDFGTGYSSMSYLKRLEPGEIKIDRSFISNIENDKDNQVIVESILSMAEHFGMTVVAEGVETEQERAFLQQKNCQLYQGYLYSRPLPEDDFIVFLQKFRNH